MDPNLERQHRLLSALADKYRALRGMRDAPRTEADVAPRAQLAALAARFPGALRELDELPMPIIEQRLLAIEDVLARGAAAELWMLLQSAYHGRLRAALRIKRLLRERGHDDHDDRDDQNDRASAEAPVDLRALGYVAAEDEPSCERIDAAALQLIRRPERGRLNPWVFREVAAEHDTTPDEVRRALFLR